MTGADTDGGPVPGLELEIPPKPAFVRTARHAVGALARLHDLPEDLVEDLKLAVSEACNTAVAAMASLDQAGPPAPISVSVSATPSRIQIEVFDPSATGREVAGAPTEIDTEDLPFERVLSLPIIRGLVDEVSITAATPQGLRMRMVVNVPVTAGSSAPE